MTAGFASRVWILAVAVGLLPGALTFRPVLAGSGGGRTLIFTHDSHQYRLSLSGGQPRPFADNATSYWWSGDGKHVLARSPGKRTTLSILTAGGALDRKVSGNPNITAAGWEAGGKRVIFTSVAARQASNCHDGGTKCGPRLWTLFYRVGPRGGAQLLWPRQPIADSTMLRADAGISLFPSFGDPALAALKGELINSTPEVLSAPKPRLIVFAKPFGAKAAMPWQVLDTETGRHRRLPFGPAAGSLSSTGLFSGGPVDSVALTPRGMVAGTIDGRVAFLDLTKRSRPRLIARGYDPVWSADGKWLFYVATRTSTTLRFQMRVHVPGIFACVRHGRLHLARCAASRHPNRLVWMWTRVTSPVNDISVKRIEVAGGKPQTLFTVRGYGLADLNPVGGNNGVIFSIIPSDLGLWMHRNRRSRVTAGDSVRYRPYISIESWTPGSQPTLLVDRGRLPAVQP